MKGHNKPSVVQEATKIPRFCYQYGEVTLQSNTENRISGVHHRFGDNDFQTPQSKDERNQAGVQKAPAGTTGVSTSDCTHGRSLSYNLH